MKKVLYAVFGIGFLFSCAKENDLSKTINASQQDSLAASFYFQSLQIDDQSGNVTYYHISINPTIKLQFSQPVDSSTVSNNIQLKQNGTVIPVKYNYKSSNKIVVVKPNSALKYITKYTIFINSNLKSSKGVQLGVSYQYNEVTTIDSTDKFPRISDNKLLNLLQQKTFNFYWLWANPISGMAKERFSSDICTTGGTGFAIMNIPVAVKRKFITRADGLARALKVVNFLDTKAQKYHGAFAHWINGGSGATIPFSPHDDGADLVETSYLMEGLLTVRQFFDDSTNADETSLRNTINKLYKNVEWDWFRNGQNTLYWHWSPNYEWDTYQQVKGWNEALITYVMAASSPTHPIDLATYQNGWASNGAIKNGNTYYGQVLPLGPSNGGPLFFEHYSFLGIDPNGLTDAYADYDQQTVAHSLINYNYCVANPKRYNGYSDSCWGLTASDDNLHGYLAHEPNNDDGVISPTAALSSFPYMPDQSMAALKFFYYKLGDRLWNSYYGFGDAFNLTEPWFDSDFLAIDQMPIPIMVENYRTGLVWNLFMSCKEVKKGMRKLKFQSPRL